MLAFRCGVDSVGSCPAGTESLTQPSRSRCPERRVNTINAQLESAQSMHTSAYGKLQN